ncbi:hypothetical protein [Desulfobacterium sp. N47]|uniref:Uncharacterized protein n=1 Tax=uncultured Desulfobacterium sp. TaxID=201089 RepID=E1YML5_9BACT|nr:unknown protein [uncultured Desulfobacterium sp.]
MNFAEPIQYLRDNLKTVKIVMWICIAGALAFDVYIKVFAAHHAEHGEIHSFADKLFIWAETIPCFWSAFGLICCILLIRIMKGLSHTVLMRKEGYYE